MCLWSFSLETKELSTKNIVKAIKIMLETFLFEVCLRIEVKFASNKMKLINFPISIKITWLKHLLLITILNTFSKLVNFYTENALLT